MIDWLLPPLVLLKQKCCFIGGEAVSWLTSRGHASSRANAVALGEQMFGQGLIHSVDGCPQFIDGYAFYRFACDVVSMAAGRHVRASRPPAPHLRPWPTPFGAGGGARGGVEGSGIVGPAGRREGEALAVRAAHGAQLAGAGCGPRA